MLETEDKLTVFTTWIFSKLPCKRGLICQMPQWCKFQEFI